MKLSCFISVFAVLIKVQQSYSTLSRPGSRNIQSEALSELVPEKVASMEPHFKFLIDAVKEMPFSLVFQYFLKLTSLYPNLGKLNRIMNDINDYVNGSDAEKKTIKSSQTTAQPQYENMKSFAASLTGDSKEEIEAEYESHIQKAKQEYNEAKAVVEACYKNASSECDEVRRKLAQKVAMVKSKSSEWMKDVDEKFKEILNTIKKKYEEEVETVNVKMKKARSECEEIYGRGQQELEESKNRADTEMYNAQWQCQDALHRANGSPEVMSQVNEYMRKVEAKCTTDLETAAKKWEQVKSESFGKWQRVKDECQKSLDEASTGREMLLKVVNRVRNDSEQIHEKMLQRLAKEFEGIDNLFRQKNQKINGARKQDSPKAGVQRASSNAQNLGRVDSKKVNRLF